MKKAAFLVIAIVIASTSLAFATSVIQLSPKQILGEAALVMTGEVTGIASRVVTGGMTPIVTDVTLRVDSVIKGKAGTTIVVTVPGGKKGEGGLAVFGAPVFQMGDRVLLALDGDEKSGWHVRGLFQGRFTLFDAGPGFGPVAVQDPVKRVAHDVAECKDVMTACVAAYQVKFTIDEVKNLIGTKP